MLFIGLIGTVVPALPGPPLAWAGLLAAPTVILIILGPFIGAFIGEMIHDSSDTGKAFNAALGAFKGFMLGTGIKLIAVCAFIWIFVWSVVK